jgi:hypothetical protein
MHKIATADFLSILSIPLAVSFFGVTMVIALNLMILAIGSGHYRAITAQAWNSGALRRTHSQLFAPNKPEYPTGSDCILLSMLSLPRAVTLKNAISPQAFVGDIDIQGRSATTKWHFAARGAYCATLEHTLGQLNSHQTVPTAYYHRYIHGDMTVAGMVLTVFSYSQASLILILAMVFMIVTVAVSALREGKGNRERGLAFLVIALVLAVFYGLPEFDQSFCFAPTDILVVSFILIGLESPFCLITEKGLIFTVASFAMGVAVLEFLTGGIPLGLTVLITLIALGEAPNEEVLLRRELVAIGVFCGTIALCFAYKLLLVRLIWGPVEIQAFVDQLFYQIGGGSVILGLPPQETAKIERLFHTPIAVIDQNRVLRLALMVTSLVYESFILGLGSHTLGALLVVLPTPIVIIGTLRRIASSGKSAHYKMFFLSLLAAALVCPLWYLAFEQHTIHHALYMVRPLVWSVALCGVFLIPKGVLELT